MRGYLSDPIEPYHADPRNIFTLRGDLHLFLFDEAIFTVVPKYCQFRAHFLKKCFEAGQAFQDVQLQDANVLSMELLYARFAWALMKIMGPVVEVDSFDFFGENNHEEPAAGPGGGDDEGEDEDDGNGADSSGSDDEGGEEDNGSDEDNNGSDDEGGGEDDGNSGANSSGGDTEFHDEDMDESDSDDDMGKGGDYGDKSDTYGGPPRKKAKTKASFSGTRTTPYFDMTRSSYGGSQGS